ncbi:MAG: hypothetical protein KAW46_05045 [candidate division Zixibacteria bacterium]|nr:hypothetical protein [candidate division Zixibacteria bacterium]
MSKLITQVSPIAVTLLAIACLSCDDYNIVEPRFYSEDEIVEFADCARDPFVEPTGAAFDSITIVLPKLIPALYAVDGCWYNRAEGVLAVFVALPEAGPTKVSILNSGGGVEAVLFDGSEQAGYLVFPWVAKKDGVYAISLQARFSVVLWFEVD